jgi:hypothetical protein
MEGYIIIPPGKNALSYLPEGYVFMDYIYVLKGVPLFTYHRDVTSSKTIFQTKRTTYTLITYEYSGNFLSVSPSSHLTWTFGLPTTISGPKGQGILFDCDLVHGGVDAPPGVEREAKQYKIVHKDDMHLLTHLNGVNVTNEGAEVSYLGKIFMRIFSYIFLVPIQLVFLPLLHRQYMEGIGAFMQRCIPINHYNNYSTLVRKSI